MAPGDTTVGRTPNKSDFVGGMMAQASAASRLARDGRGSSSVLIDNRYLQPWRLGYSAVGSPPFPAGSMLDS
jgi:hypothetical protein